MYLKGLITRLITDNLDFLIEDFSEDDIEIDKWNGRIQKENVKLKKNSFEWLTQMLVGAPCTVVQGYIKRLKIDVPWSELQSRPIEVTIEDLHVVLTSSEGYQRQYVKDALIKLKQMKVEELCKTIEKQLKNAVAGEQEQAKAEQSGFLKRMTAVILENLRINVRHVHVRFEDNRVSRRDQAFNFGIIAESITYSMTNNRFVRAFLNIDDKLQEQRSFSMLKFLKLAAYWNSNAQDNWTKSREFIYQGAQGTIAFSRSHMEILMSKHNASKLEMNHSNVFLIQPTDISVKFRTNLAPQQQQRIPLYTTAIDFSNITLSLDEEVLKDIQLVSKFFAWHAMSIHKAGFLKYRPAYNVPVKHNARTYWRYAIRATIYLIRKQQQECDPIRMQKKRKLEMIELSELYRLEKVNDYLKSAGVSERHLIIDEKVQVARFRAFRNEACLERRRKHLEYKLQPEQIVISLKKAEKESQVVIKDHQAKSGWRAWVPSRLKNWYSGSEENAPEEEEEERAQRVSAEDAQFNDQMDQILAKANQLQKDERQVGVDDEDKSDVGGQPDEQRQRRKLVYSHLTVSVPLIELLIVSRQHGAYNAKCFMSTALQDIFYQRLLYKNGNEQQLFSLRSLDIIDKLVQSPKFQRAVFKGPIRQPSAQQATDLTNRALQRFSQQNVGRIGGRAFPGIDHQSSLHEVEEESNPYENNGLPRVRYFQDVTSNVGEVEKFFFLMQMTATHVSPQPAVSADGLQQSAIAATKKYKIDTMLNHTVLFYNRMLISRAQTFIHQATLSKTQNAQAEADFDSKMSQLRKRGEAQVNDLLEKSEFEFACALKGVEVLVPDDVNFQESRFLLLQTGNLMARSRQPFEQKYAQRNQTNGFDLGPQQQQQSLQQQKMDPLFVEALRKKLLDPAQQPLLNELDDEPIPASEKPALAPVFSKQQVTFMRLLEGGTVAHTPMANSVQRVNQMVKEEDYALTVFDIQLLYLPSFSFLEAIQYNELSKEDVDKRFSLLKRTDLSLDFSKLIVVKDDMKPAEAGSLIKVALSIANIDCRMTTREVKEFKSFADKFLQYHRDLEHLVEDELDKMRMETQFRQSIDRRGTQTSAVMGDALEAPISSRREYTSSDDVSSVVLNAVPGIERRNSFLSSCNSSSKGSGSDDDEFFDAVEEFDQEIINLLTVAMNEQEQLKKKKKKDKSSKIEPTPRINQLGAIQEEELTSEEEEDDTEEVDGGLTHSNNAVSQQSMVNKLAICASINVGKFRFQVLEATDIRKEYVRSLNEKLQQNNFGGGNESIELSIQQKGLPFLNFEISQSRVTLLTVPSMLDLKKRPQLTNDILVSTVSVRNFCLMNQEKVSQPQILLRSSNYGVEQAQQFAGKDRTTSFDQQQRRDSSDLGLNNSPGRNTGTNKDKSGEKPHYVFDLEDEDNMAMIEQAPDEVQDYFIRCTLDSNLAKRYEEQQIVVEEMDDETVIESDTTATAETRPLSAFEALRGEEEKKSEQEVKIVYKQVAEDKQVAVDVNLGLTEGEITEHSMRKIMECLVADFPLSAAMANSNTGDETLNQQDKSVVVAENSEEDIENRVVKSRYIKAHVHSEGLNYKMRLRKEESVLKIIDVTLDFTDQEKEGLESDRTIQVDLVDFRVLHQNNELIFKHSFGTDEDLLLPSETKIWTLSFKKVGDKSRLETNLNNFLFIFESKACLQILQNMTTLKNLVKSAPRLFTSKPVSKANTAPASLNQSFDQQNQQAEGAGDLAIVIQLNACHLQLPVTESKNSLFIELSTIQLEHGNNRMEANFQAVDIYVAKQINQNKRYYMVQLHRSSLLAELAPGGIAQRLEAKLGLLKLTMNENYLLFLASLIEYHFNDVQALISFIGKLAVMSEPQPSDTTRQQQIHQGQQIQSVKKDPLSESQVRSLSQRSPFLKSILATENQTLKSKDEEMGIDESPITQIIKLSVDSVSFEWVFGLGFDDHEESFVTLSNRNFSKLILDQFDRTRQTLKMHGEPGSQGVYSDALDKNELLIDPTQAAGGIKKSASRAAQLGSLNNLLDPNNKQNSKDDVAQEDGTSSYEKLTLRFEDITVERVCAVSETIYLNGTCRQILLEQRSPQLRQPYPVLLIRPQSAQESVKVTSTQSMLKAEVSFFDLRICQRSVTVVSNLAKDVYSCKNVIKRGKKRRFFRALFKRKRTSSADQQQQEPIAATEATESSFEVSAVVRKIRVLCYDSCENEAKKAAEISRSQSTPARQFVRGLAAQAIEDFGDDPDQAYFQPGSLLTLETGVRISNLKPVRQQDVVQESNEGDHDSNEDSQEDDGGGYQPDRQLNVKVSNFCIFTNTSRTTLMETPSLEQRLMLLYPTDVVFGQQFYSQKNLSMLDIQVSLIEFETSFKQVFLYQLLINKMINASKPVTQIFEFIDSQQHAKAGGESQKRKQQRAPQNGMLLSLHINSIYFALIKELGASSGGSNQGFGDCQNAPTCMPMLSFEIKWFELRQKTQITGLQQTDVTFPLELYYFNQRLNFFEPAIERVLMKANIVADVSGNQEKRFTVEDVLNVNFSVALYENIFVLLENLTLEREAFKKMVEQTERENLMASLRTLNADKQGPAAAATMPQAATAGAYQHDSSFYMTSSSLNFIKNKTGELLLFKPGRQPAFTEMQANETLPLDFQKSNLMGAASGQNLLSAEDNTSKGLFDGIASSEMQPDSDILSNNMPESSSEDGDSEPEAEELSNFVRRGQTNHDMGQKPRSMYRRGKYKFKKSEPNKIVLQIMIHNGKELDRTPSFEINFDSLSCQRVFLDENRELYVICQIQNKDGQKILIVRSPMQVTNNLQIPVEVLLHSSSALQLQNQKTGAMKQQQSEESKEFTFRRSTINRTENLDFSMVIKPEQSMIIPLQACGFKSVQIRPLIAMVGKAASSMYTQESQFEWSQKAEIGLLQEERLIFEQKPMILCSRMTRNNYTVDRNNNQVYFALNANTYSIRSYIDFNTQQTDFISLRYLSITAPFTIQNLIPVPITMLFKNVERIANRGDGKSGPASNAANNKTFLDQQMYDLELKHNSSLQVLYLNPLGNFDFSLAIPGYDQSNFVKFKLKNEADYELCTDMCQSNYLDSVNVSRKANAKKARPSSSKSNGRPDSAGNHAAAAQDEAAAEDKKPDGDNSQLLQTAQFRFVKQKKILLQLCSQFQSQFNICANIAFVQGFYHISFYAKYWFLNNTQMPLQARISQKTFAFPTLDLPYLSLDFDFDTVKQFQDQDYGQNDSTQRKGTRKSGKDDEPSGAAAQPTLKRRDSGETFITETVREGAAPGDDARSAAEDSMADPSSIINYKRLKGQIRAIDTSGESYSKGGMLRVKPWEAYRYNEGLSKGLLAALSQEDIDRVSSIYFTQEMIKEEEKVEESEYVTCRGRLTSQSDAFLTAKDSNTDAFLSARSHFKQSSQQNTSSAEAATIKEKRPSKNVQFQLGDSEDPSQSASKESGVLGGMKRLGKVEESSSLLRVEKLTKLSKSTIQMANFQHNRNAQQAVPLNHTYLSEFEIYDAPLEDKDQLQRVILFSDVPTEENAIAAGGAQEGPGDTTGTTPQEQQLLRLRVCDSEWSDLPFDLSRLQSEPIQIKDVHRKEGSPQSLFELVAVVTFLPQPFSFSKLICFQPRYLMVNRTFHTLYVVQSECEEQGTFKIFPQETSVFHWTDADKPLEVCVTLNDHEYSGNLRIDGIGEFNLRLKNQYEQDSTILNVSISEETNSFYIVFTDVSYAPPYRLENLTKTRFKVSQVMARPDDFDHLNPFQPLSFAWSYPLQPKLLRISLSQIDTQEDLGTFSIDSISKTERITMKDRHRGRTFILEITNEKTMKVVRILNPQQTLYEDALEEQVKVDEEAQLAFAKHTKLKVKVNRLGLSLINSQAREICYTSIFNLRFSLDSTSKHQKVAVKAGDLQIDNQLSRQPDAIILKREQTRLGKGDFIQIKFHFVKNMAIENLLYYKYLIFSIVPFELNLDGNFCDETYKYILEVFQLTSKFTSKAKVAASSEALLKGLDSTDPTVQKQPTLLANVGDEVEQIKNAFNELKKKGHAFSDTQRDVQKIYVEQFQISEIRLNFSFSSSPILFREFTMNPTLKFFLVLLSNLKNVRLGFSKYHLQNQHMQVSFFLTQIKRFYWQECCNHKQLFKIVSSMGLFGSISTTVAGISTAFKSMIQRPFITYHQENTVKAILLGSVVFVKDSLWVLSGSVSGIYDSLRNGFSVLVAYGQTNQEMMDMVVDRELFEDDIEQAQKGITAFSTPLTSIDTQNRIWLKILMREKQNLDDKKRIIMRKQQSKMDQSQGTDAGAGNQSETVSGDSQLAKSSGPTSQYIIDTRAAQQEYSLFYRMAYFTSQGALFLPRKIFGTGKAIFSSFIPDDISLIRTQMIVKVRPPRFVSFTMELEPYSKKKAFALEILNDINLHVIESETIRQLYSMNSHVIIITGKRIICVDELSKHLVGSQNNSRQGTGQKIMSGLEKMIPGRRGQKEQAQAAAAIQPEQPGGQELLLEKIDIASMGGKAAASGVLEENQGESFDNNNPQYKHWNIFFKDIYRVSIDIVDRETNSIISQQDLEKLLHGNIADRNDRQLKIFFVLKIFYQLNDEDDDGSGEAQTFNINRGRRNARDQQSKKNNDGGGMLGALSGLKVGRKQIVSRDWKVMRRVYTAIQNFQRRSTLI